MGLLTAAARLAISMVKLVFDHIREAIAMTRIICLANSWKRGERCIAGIEPGNGRWVRPISDLPDGQIPKQMRLLKTMEPALLDILEIPLADTGPDFGFESENLSVLPGKWQRKGKIKPIELLEYCSKEKYILHNEKRYVTVGFMQSLPVEKRRTLELIKAVNFSVRPIKDRWEASLMTENGQSLTTTITDPVFVRKLELNYRPQNMCLVTVSLSMPWRPDDWEEDEEPCWKLIAGVVELPEGKLGVKKSAGIKTILDDDDEDILF